jgi:hypothetical protein
MGLLLNRIIKFNCPCGYSFEMSGIMIDAISMVKLHFESFHKNDLPFGITDDEAGRLLIEPLEEIKPKIYSGFANSDQIESNNTSKESTSTLQSLLEKILGRDIEAKNRTEKKERKLASIL